MKKTVRIGIALGAVCGLGSAVANPIITAPYTVSAAQAVPVSWTAMAMLAALLLVLFASKSRHLPKGRWMALIASGTVGLAGCLVPGSHSEAMVMTPSSFNLSIGNPAISTVNVGVVTITNNLGNPASMGQLTVSPSNGDNFFYNFSNDQCSNTVLQPAASCTVQVNSTMG